MLNSIIIMGRLVADPELRSTPNGIAVCTIRVAVDRDGSGRNGTEKQTDFIDVVTWRQTAEFVSQYFSKGRMIIVQGSLQSSKWQDRDGNNRTSWEIQANNVWFGEAKNASGGGYAYNDPNRFDSYTPPPVSNSTHGDVPSQSQPSYQPAPQDNQPAPQSNYSSGSDDDFIAVIDEDLPF